MTTCRNLVELIAELQSLKARHGDLPVMDSRGDFIEPEFNDEDGAPAIIVCDKA